MKWWKGLFSSHTHTCSRSFLWFHHSTADNIQLKIAMLTVVKNAAVVRSHEKLARRNAHLGNCLLQLPSTVPLWEKGWIEGKRSWWKGDGVIDGQQGWQASLDPSGPMPAPAGTPRACCPGPHPEGHCSCAWNGFSSGFLSIDTGANGSFWGSHLSGTAPHWSIPEISEVILVLLVLLLRKESVKFHLMLKNWCRNVEGFALLFSTGVMLGSLLYCCFECAVCV